MLILGKRWLRPHSGIVATVTCILRREATNRSPIEGRATLSQQAQKPIVQQAPQWHRHLQTFGRRK